MNKFLLSLSLIIVLIALTDATSGQGRFGGNAGSNLVRVKQHKELIRMNRPRSNALLYILGFSLVTFGFNYYIFQCMKGLSGDPKKYRQAYKEANQVAENDHEANGVRPSSASPHPSLESEALLRRYHQFVGTSDTSQSRDSVNSTTTGPSEPSTRPPSSVAPEADSPPAPASEPASSNPPAPADPAVPSDPPGPSAQPGQSDPAQEQGLSTWNAQGPQPPGRVVGIVRPQNTGPAE
ncbi:hypothetical protein HDE_06519 [Halotydeus destructor]|nr:hypothetical protein HDE_06519 [Halotydeus destructor]